MSCDVGKATEGLGNELWLRWSDGKVGEWAELIDIYSRAHSPTLPSLTYVTAHSPTHLSLLLRHRLFTYITWRAAHAPHAMNHAKTITLEQMWVYIKYPCYCFRMIHCARRVEWGVLCELFGMWLPLWRGLLIQLINNTTWLQAQCACKSYVQNNKTSNIQFCVKLDLPL